MNFLNFFKKNKQPEVGKTISWKDSINVLFKIIDFDRNGTITEGAGSIKAKSIYAPYGYLIVTNPNFTSQIRLPIIHKDDFFLAESVYSDPRFLKMAKEKDFLVTYRPKLITPNGLAGIDHALHYCISPNGTIVKYYDKYANEINTDALDSIFIRFSWDILQVQINPKPLY
jgi:hypothetical protein